MTFRAILLLTVVLTSFQSTNAQESNQGPETQNLIRIAQETTFITEPLDPEGFVDYVAALNELRSKGVTPKNNYEMVVRKLITAKGSESVDNWKEKYFAALDTPVPKATPFALVDFVDYLEPNKENTNGRTEFEILRKRETLLEKPWQPDERPIAARWVQEMNELLDELVEGSKRPEFWAPYVSVDMDLSKPMPRVGLKSLAPVIEQREIARAIGIRAMGRIGTGELEDAWNDLLALQRISCHVASGYTEFEGSLVSYVLEKAWGLEIASALLSSPKLTDELAAECFKDLKARPPLPSFAEHALLGERFMRLDEFATLARRCEQEVEESLLHFVFSLRHMPATPEEGLEELHQAVHETDWNECLRQMNAWFDRLDEAATAPRFPDQKKLFEKLSYDFRTERYEIRKLRSYFELFSKAESTEATSKRLSAAILPESYIKSIEMKIAIELEARASFDMLKIAFALECYRRKEGKQAAMLSDLVPNYFENIPIDGYSGEPIRYLTRDGKTLLYCVGRNVRDDKGRTFDETHSAPSFLGLKPNWDDIVFELPTPTASNEP